MTLIILTMLFGGGSVEIFSRTDIRAVDEVFVLRDNMTRAEWDKIFNAH